MQVICPISGRAWQRDDLFTGVTLAGHHPIFSMKKKDLLTEETIHRYNKSFNNLERKLYFLAVLNATELVYFNSPALPSVRTVEANFLPLVTITYWLDYAQFQFGRDVSFPKYVVSKANEHISNVDEWIASLESIRVGFIQKDIDRERSRKNLIEHQRMQRELASAFLKDQAFTSYLVDWAFQFEMPDQPAGIVQKKLEDHPRADFYKDVLTSKLTMAFTIDDGVLPEIESFLYDNLPMYHPCRIPIMGQLQQLMAAKKKGFNDWEIIDNDSGKDIESVGRKATDFTRVQVKMRDDYISATGGLEEPKKENFASKHAYFLAHARWIAAKDIPVVQAAPIEEIPSVEEQVKEHFEEESYDEQQDSTDTGDGDDDNDRSTEEEDDNDEGYN